MGRSKARRERDRQAQTEAKEIAKEALDKKKAQEDRNGNATG